MNTDRRPCWKFWLFHLWLISETSLWYGGKILMRCADRGYNVHNVLVRWLHCNCWNPEMSFWWVDASWQEHVDSGDWVPLLEWGENMPAHLGVYVSTKSLKGWKTILVQIENNIRWKFRFYPYILSDLASAMKISWWYGLGANNILNGW